MRPDQFTLRCYAEKQGDIAVAVCIDLTLAAQADSMDEARRKLDEQIASYLHDIFVGEDRTHIRDLFPRRAPFGFVAKYYWIAAKWKLARSLHRFNELRCRRSQAFNEFWPALIKH